MNNEYGIVLENDPDDVLSQSFELEKQKIIEDLKQNHIQHRQFVKSLNKRTKEDEENQAKLKEVEENIKSAKSKKFIKNNAYVDRRFLSMSAKARAQTDRMKNLLNKVDTYMKRIDKIDEVEKLKMQAEKEFDQEEKKRKTKVDKFKLDCIVGRLAKLNKHGEVERENNINKIKEREKSKSKIIKNVKTFGKEILKNLLPGLVGGSIRPPTASISKKGLFGANLGTLFAEEEFIGTNAMPLEVPSSTSSLNLSLPAKKERRVASAKSLNLTKHEMNNYDKKTVDLELRQILKSGSNVELLLNFKNKYKWYDISPYLHKVQMDLLKNRSSAKNADSDFNNRCNKTNKQNKLTKEAEKKLQMMDEDSNSNNILSSFTLSCVYNNSDYIQTHLLACKDDSEVFLKINERDLSNRKGIIYLILNGNFPMIKLTLMSGLILSDCRDKWGRNILHYSAMSKHSGIIDVICKCITFEYKEDLEGMTKYLGKIYMSEDFQNHHCLSEEEKIRLFEFIDNSFENKESDKEENNYNNENENNVEEEKLTIFSPLGKSNKINEDKISFINSMTVLNEINFYFKEVKKSKLSLITVINQLDSDNRTPLHLACINNNFEVIRSLLFNNAKSDLKDKIGNRPIDYCTSDNIIQYIISHTKNIQSKEKLEKSSFLNKILNVNSLIGNSNNNKNKIVKSLQDEIDESLDVNNLKYISDSKLNTFTNGYENNNYLILSVIHNKFEAFCYLLKRNINISFKNSNAWNVIHYIVTMKRIKYLSFIFNTKENINSEADTKIYSDENISYIYESIKSTDYSTNDIYDTKGELNTLGVALTSLDILTNNSINCLIMSIDSKYENFLLFKLLVNLLIKREMLSKSGNFFNEKISALEIILNRKYDKSSSTLLLKAVEKKNFEIVEYLTKEFNEEYKESLNLNNLNTSPSSSTCEVDIYGTDKHLNNILHIGVKNKLDNKFIKYFIKLDSDKNILKYAKDNNDKSPQDYDTSKQYAISFFHIWEATKNNDHILIQKLISEENYKINEQTLIYKNAPLHLAAMNNSDKAALFLIKNGCDENIKNNKNLTALDIALANKTNSSTGKAFFRKFKAILNKEITEFVQLESYGKNLNNTLNLNSSLMNNSMMSNLVGTNMGKKVNTIRLKIKSEVEKRKLNFKKIFEAVDENKNGKLEGHEFESLFTVIGIEGVSRDDVLLLMSFLDKNKNGIIEYQEFIQILE